MISVLPIAGLAIFNTFTGERLIFNTTRKALLTRANHLSERIDDLNTHLRERAEILASNPLFATGETADDPNPKSKPSPVSALIENWKEAVPAVESVFILDGNGRSLFPSRQPAISTALFDKSLLGLSQMSDISVPADATVPVVTLYVPIRDHRGNVPRVLLVRVKANAYWNLVESFDEADGPGSFASVINQNGIFLACGMDRNAIFRPAGDLSNQVMDQLSSTNNYGPATKTFLSEPHPMPAVMEKIKRNVASDVFTTSVASNPE